MGIKLSWLFKIGELALLSLLLIALYACSISKSSTSSSDIVSSPFKSSSDSSSPDKDTEYKDDVADFTSAYVKSTAKKDGDGTVGDGNESFKIELSNIATQNGVVNWDTNPLTYHGIGKGLKKAGLKGEAYETYKKNLSNSDYGKMQDIQKGYDGKDRVKGKS